MADEGRVALVTGAGRGIGRGVAARLSAEGHAVGLVSRTEAQLHETAALCSGPTLVLARDITSTSAVDEVFAAVEHEWGPVDVLVACAGAGASAPLAATSDEMWEEMLALNLTAPFRCIRRAVPAMVDRGGGSIVVVASVVAKRGEPYVAAYTASKHGVLGVVRSAAAELATKGVTVNAVCPGYVDTPMTDHTIEVIAERTGRTRDEARRELERKQPHQRLVTVDEVVAAVWACVSNPGISGQALVVDGGGLQ
ncbi:MAG TPA: SDR family oxidoreductase [Nocardioides sp.]|uniref:SDR family NAD(P)-dependent oxidoreductase n=1 Tax=Nocardioides sp. TaxID=35761 RepID=UPI002E31D1E2|nr:SDR family oxidoreductase [Nocardioides sp.]HEX5087563.1 SDR family oxidoreductase [Nocardioides sp.]